MSKKSKEEERRILERMYGNEKSDKTEEKSEADTDGKADADADTSGQTDERNSVPCPICGHRLKAGTKVCPKCGYSGYVPLTDAQTAKIRLILFPVILVIAVIIYLYVRGYFG